MPAFPPRLLIIADVGGEETRHIGDEAMLEANLAAFRRLVPDAAFTVVARDPARVAEDYGVDAIAPVGFPAAPAVAAVRRAMLDHLLAEARSGARGNATVDAVADADALILSGGGNLSSTWPDLLYERVCLLQLASIFEKPTVVLGQTLGPRLGSDERHRLAEALSSARFLGLRELSSAALAMELGVPPERLWYQCDDALVIERDPGSTRQAGNSGAPTIAVTIDPQIRAAGEAAFGSLIRQLRELAEATGASLVLAPHAFGGEASGTPSDLTEARLIADRLGLASTVVEAGLHVGRARQIAADAALVISSRYHPVVFGLGAGTPCIGIYGDEYCRIKLQGALAHAHLERWTLTYDDVSQGKLLTAALELWRMRDQVRQSLKAQQEAWREESRKRWLAVLRALDPAAAIPSPDTSAMLGRSIQEIAAAFASALEARREAWESERVAFERLLARTDFLESQTRWLKGQLGPLRTLRRYAGALLRSLGLR